MKIQTTVKGERLVVFLFFLGISLAFIVGGGVVIIRDLYTHYYNPLPKFENGDKRIDEIHFIKTRKI